MAEEDQNEQDQTLEVDDESAEQLLNDGTDTESTDDGEPAKDTGPSELETERDKWKKLSRQNEANLRKVQRELQEIKDKDKSESQRLTEERDSLKTSAEKAADELKRMNIATDLAPEGATLAQLRKVAKRLRGDNDEELEADAKELWDDFGPSKSPTAGRPKERLRGGSDPTEEPDEKDPRKLAALIPRAR